RKSLTAIGPDALQGAEPIASVVPHGSSEVLPVGFTLDFQETAAMALDDLVVFVICFEALAVLDVARDGGQRLMHELQICVQPVEQDLGVIERRAKTDRVSEGRPIVVTGDQDGMPTVF